MSTVHCGADDGSTICVLPRGHGGAHRSEQGRIFYLAEEWLTPEVVQAGMQRVINQLNQDNRALLARVRQLEAGLAEYANPENWKIHTGMSYGGANVWTPGGAFSLHDINGFDLARAALAGRQEPARPAAGPGGGSEER